MVVVAAVAVATVQVAATAVAIPTEAEAVVAADREAGRAIASPMAAVPVGETNHLRPTDQTAQNDLFV